MKNRNIEIDLLKVFTVLLIINSHSDILYPSKIQFLASGGAIGNELFLMISGYLFSKKTDISKDVRKRFVRLYLPTYIMLIITWVLGRFNLGDGISIIQTFIWPTAFWFIGAIFVYSCIMYLLIKIGIDNQNKFIVFGIMVLVIDLILFILFIPDKSTWIVEDAYFGFMPYRSIYSIFSFVLGYYIRGNKERSTVKMKESNIVLIAVVLFMGFYGFKLLLNKNIIPMPMQIISHPLTIACAFFIFLSFAQMNLNTVVGGKRVEQWINSIASLSLESYLVQFLVIAGVASSNIAFPLNFAVCVPAILATAWLLHWASSRLIRLVLQGHST